MKNKIVQLAFMAALTAALAVPALAQSANWKLKPDHSTGRLTLTSTADPSAAFDVGVANVRGAVSLDASLPANSSFNFTIYPAHQDQAALNDDGSLNSAEFSNLSRSTVINFRSRRVEPIGDGNLAVTGDLTVSHLERPVVITADEAYAGPVYGEPEVHSVTREVTFVFNGAVAMNAKATSARKLELIATTNIKTEDFPGLFEAVTESNWPVAVQEENCQIPPLATEDYSGAVCTGTPAVYFSGPQVSPLTVGEDYPGPNSVTAQVHDNVKIALNLELTRSTAASGAAAGN